MTITTLDGITIEINAYQNNDTSENSTIIENNTITENITDTEDITITKNSTIKQLKEAYAKTVIKEAELEDASNFQFEMGGHMLRDNMEVGGILSMLQNNKKVGEIILNDKVTITAKKKSSRMNCFQDISNVDSNLSPIDRLPQLKTILGKKIGFDKAGTPILASSDESIVLAAVEKDGEALEYASIKLKADKEIVLAAVKQSGLALFFASIELKKDKEVVLAAVQENGLAFVYGHDALKGEEIFYKDFVLAAVEQNGRALQGVPQELTTKKNLRDPIFFGSKSPMINFKKRITGAPSTSSSGGPANDTPKTPLLGENKTNLNINAPRI